MHWLKTAANVPGFIGFAVGRTSFWQPLVDVEAKRLSKEEAARHIAQNFEAWINIFAEAFAREGARRGEVGQEQQGKQVAETI